MFRSVTLWRTVLQRARAEWPVVLAAWLLLACATTLLSAGVIYSDAVSLSGLRHTLAAAPPADRTVEVDTSATPHDVAEIDGLVRPQLAAALQPAGGDVALMARADGFAPTAAAATDTTHLTGLASLQGVESHARLLQGRWPQAGQRPVQAALSEGAAQALGLTAGSHIALADRLEVGLTVDLQVTAVYRPDPADPYWQDNTLALTGILASGTSTTRGPFVVALPDLIALPVTHKLDLQWVGVLDVSALRPDQLDTLEARLTGLPGSLTAALPGGSGFTTSSQLPAIVAGASAAILVARGGILILALQFAAVAGYAVVLVGGVLLERRRPAMALLRSRGASQAHLVALALGEAALLAVPAVIVAPFLAVGVVRLLDSVGPLTATGVVAAADITTGGVLVALAAGVACAAALTLPTLTSGLGPGAVRAALGRQVGATLPQRLGLDLALVAVAALALWQLRLYGAPLTRTLGGTLGLDPLLVAAPAIGLVAGALIATRLVPRLAELAERLLARRRGLIAGYGARQLARRPLRYTRATLLILLAVALGTFAAAYAATWTRSQADQAAFQTAADERIVVATYPDVPRWTLGTAYRALPGVETAMAVFDQELEVGNAVRDGALQAVDPATAARIVSFPSDPSGGATPVAGLTALAAARSAPSGMALPAGTRRLGVTVATDLGTPSMEDVERLEAIEGGEVDLSVVLDGPDGLVRIPGPALATHAASKRYEIPLTVPAGGTTLAMSGPLRLQAVELTITTPYDGLEIRGSVNILQVATSATDTAPAWQPLSLYAPSSGWAWQLVQQAGTTPLTAEPKAPGQVVVGPDGSAGRPLVLDPVTDPSATLRLWAPVKAPAALPAIVTDSFLTQTGVQVGDTVRVTSLGYSLTLHVMGRAAALPPLDPTTASALIDAADLQARTFSDVGRLASPQEWWLQTDPGSGPALETTVAGPGYSAASVIGRATLTQRLTDDPISLGAIGALFLGTVVALTIATIGFLVSASISVEERLGEFALLRALGVSRRAVALWLIVENTGLLGFGLLVGGAVGWLLAWLVLPFASFTPDGTAPVPVPALLLPWQALTPLVAVGAGALLVTSLVARRQLAGIDISGRLRAGEA